MYDIKQARKNFIAEVNEHTTIANIEKRGTSFDVPSFQRTEALLHGIQMLFTIIDDQQKEIKELKKHIRKIY